MQLTTTIKKYLTDNIDIYEATKTTNSYGEVVETWTKNRTVLGRIRPLSGNERLVAGAEHQISTHRLYTLDSAITENSQIRFAGKTYDVIYVSNMMNFNALWQITLQLVT